MSLATHATSLKRWFIAPYMLLNSTGLIYSLARTVISATGNERQTAAGAVAAAAPERCSHLRRAAGRATTAG